MMSLALALVTLFLAGPPRERAVARVDRDVVLQGESVEFEVSVAGPRAVDAELAPLPEVEGVEFEEVQGPSFARRSSLEGEGATYEAVFRVRARALRPGRVVVPAFEVLVASDEIVRTNRVDLVVVAREDLPEVRFSLEPRRRRVYEKEPLTLVFRIEVEGSYANALSSGLSRFSLPWWGAVLPFTDRGALKPGTGMQRRFPIEGAGRSLYLAVVRAADPDDPSRREVLEGEVTVAPLEAGRLDLETSRFLAAFAAGTRMGRMADDGILRLEAAAEGAGGVEVLPVPLQGRPADWKGLVGRVRLRAEVDRAELRVGEALEATVVIEEAEPDTTNLRFADLEQLRRVAGFRTFSAEETNERLRRVFRLELAPESPDVDEVPPFRIVTFDPASGRFVTVESEPIPIEVKPPPGGAKRGGSLRPSRLLLVGGGSAALLLVGALLGRRRRRGRRGGGRVSAEPMTADELARALQRVEDPVEAGRAFARFAAERTGLAAGALFGSEGIVRLAEVGVDRAAVEKLRRLYERLEIAGFSGRGGDAPALEEWVEAARALEAACAANRSERD